MYTNLPSAYLGWSVRVTSYILEASTTLSGCCLCALGMAGNF